MKDPMRCQDCNNGIRRYLDKPTGVWLHEIDIEGGRVVCNDQCYVNPGSSAGCAFGTKGCEVKHHVKDQRHGEVDLSAPGVVTRLVDLCVREMEALPAYRGWRFTYEYPGFFCFTHPDHDYSVFCTPDWEGDETLPIQVQVEDGSICVEHEARLPLPREGRTARQIFDLVRPTLDKLLVEARAVELRVRLTAQEIVVLQMVRDHLEHAQRGWLPRTAAISVIAKVIAAADEASS